MWTAGRRLRVERFMGTIPRRGDAGSSAARLELKGGRARTGDDGRAGPSWENVWGAGWTGCNDSADSFKCPREDDDNEKSLTEWPPRRANARTADVGTPAK